MQFDRVEEQVILSGEERNAIGAHELVFPASFSGTLAVIARHVADSRIAQIMHDNPGMPTEIAERTDPDITTLLGLAVQLEEVALEQQI